MTRHSLDLFSLVAGLICTGVALLALVGPPDFALADLRIIGPAIVLLVGVSLLVGGPRRDRT
jgi:hypothetical protein